MSCKHKLLGLNYRPWSYLITHTSYIIGGKSGGSYIEQGQHRINSESLWVWAETGSSQQHLQMFMMLYILEILSHWEMLGKEFGRLIEISTEWINQNITWASWSLDCINHDNLCWIISIIYSSSHDFYSIYIFRTESHTEMSGFMALLTEPSPPPSSSPEYCFTSHPRIHSRYMSVETDAALKLQTDMKWEYSGGLDPICYLIGQ